MSSISLEKVSREWSSLQARQRSMTRVQVCRTRSGPPQDGHDGSAAAKAVVRFMAAFLTSAHPQTASLPSKPCAACRVPGEKKRPRRRSRSLQSSGFSSGTRWCVPGFQDKKNYARGCPPKPCGGLGHCRGPKSTIRGRTLMDCDRRYLRRCNLTTIKACVN